MNLHDLVIDVDYQQKYTYEKRVDLFNKYGMPTSLEFFIPIWGLSQFILRMCEIGMSGTSRDNPYSGMGHGQRVLNSTLNDDTRKRLEETGPRIQTFENNPYAIAINYYFHDAESLTRTGKMRQVLRYNLRDKLISVNSHDRLNMSVIPSDLYDKIDEWLIDFGYKPWRREKQFYFERISQESYAPPFTYDKSRGMILNGRGESILVVQMAHHMKTLDRDRIKFGEDLVRLLNSGIPMT